MGHYLLICWWFRDSAPRPQGWVARRPGPWANSISLVMAWVGVLHLFLLSVLNQGKEITLLWKNFYPPLNSPVTTVQKSVLPWQSKTAVPCSGGLEQLLSAMPAERAAVEGFLEIISQETVELVWLSPFMTIRWTLTSNPALIYLWFNLKNLPTKSGFW